MNRDDTQLARDLAAVASTTLYEAHRLTAIRELIREVLTGRPGTLVEVSEAAARLATEFLLGLKNYGVDETTQIKLTQIFLLGVQAREAFDDAVSSRAPSPPSPRAS